MARPLTSSGPVVRGFETFAAERVLLPALRKWTHRPPGTPQTSLRPPHKPGSDRARIGKGQERTGQCRDIALHAARLLFEWPASFGSSGIELKAFEQTLHETEADRDPGNSVLAMTRKNTEPQITRYKLPAIRRLSRCHSCDGAFASSALVPCAF